MDVLVFNAGSSSLKYGLYRVAGVTAEVVVEDDARLDDETSIGDAVTCVAARLSDGGLPPPDAVGHRIVHGGPGQRDHALIDDAVLRRLDAARPFAPLHLPIAIELVRRAGDAFGGRPQVACIDTAFHATLDRCARTLPLPASLRADGIERYGFHGLSCESIVAQLGDDVPARTIVAHLGSGASVTALRDSRSIDTSMGLTPSGGTMMATRTGDLDPGVLLYLLREKRFDAAHLERLIDHEAGLVGVSGTTGDMRTLEARAADDPDAALAVAMFCRSAARQIAAMIASLDGLDLLVFTGGIGEHDAAARAAICASLRWIGVSVDADRNADGEGSVQTPDSRCEVRVMPLQENVQIARHTATLAAAATGSPARS